MTNKKTITKEQVEQVIDVLATDENLGKYLPGEKKITRPVLLGDVAIKVAEDYRDSEFPNEIGISAHLIQYSEVPEVFELWDACGRNKSLQQIASESGYDGIRKVLRLKSPEATELFLTLYGIFKNQIK